MKVALVYDRVNKWGGAERVLQALHELFPDAPLYTSVHVPQKAHWAEGIDVRPSFLQKLPLPKSHHEFFPFLMGPAFETFNLDEFDVVISVTHEFAKAVITKPQTLHICYCLNPVGYLWANHDAYFSTKGNAYKHLTAPIIRYLRFYDKVIASRPDKYIAISSVVKERIKKYYDRDAGVIYPPSNLAGQDIDSQKGEYYLIVSRLVPNKRLDRAVSAFNKSGRKLKIIGTGSEEANLKTLAKENIEFLGHLTDEELARYYRQSIALIVPAEEDFGLVAVEAQSFGKPVIALNKGGAKETVINGKTGILYDKETALGEAVEKFEKMKFLATDCKTNASKFSLANFKKVMRSEVESAWENWRKTHGL